MKINFRKEYRKPRRITRNDEVTETASGSHDDRAPHRFMKVSELMERYERAVKRRGAMNGWENILKSYSRQPWKDKDGTILPNWGFLRSQVDDKQNSFVDYATERANWAEVKTYKGESPAQSVEWSRHITAAFSECCIGRWEKKAIEMILACRDMIMFSKGILAWLDEYEIYPSNIATQHVWPDSNAGMLPSSFDLLFVQRRMSALELYQKINDPEIIHPGWNRKAVEAVIRYKADQSDRRLDEPYIQRALSEDDYEKAESIDVVYAYIREYSKEGKSLITTVIFPSKGCIPYQSPNKGLTDEDINSLGYLFSDPKREADMNEIISVVAQSVCRNYYEDPSFAEGIYTSSKVYDQVMNRILQGIEDNMRVYLKSQSTDIRNKLQRMRHGNTTIMEPGVDLVQQNLRRPVQEAMMALRFVVNESDANMQQYQTASRDNAGGYKTAKQTELDFTVAQKTESSNLKVFNIFMNFLVKELYRRFVTLEATCEWDKQSQRLFKERMEAAKIPPSAWEFENVMVTSLVDPSANSPAARIQAGQLTLQVLSRPARSPGEEEAQRDIIAAVHGMQNVDTYLPRTKLPIQEDWRIGMENDALMSPGGDSRNIQVLQTDYHLRHIPLHIQTAQHTLELMANYFKNLNQFNPDDIGVHVKTILDNMVGVDNVLSHARAHIAMSGQTTDQALIAELKGYQTACDTLAGHQDKLLKAVTDMEEARMQEARERTGADPELSAKQRLWDAQFQHEQRMMGLKEQGTVVKAEQLRAQSAQNTLQKQALEAQQAQQDMVIKDQQSQLDAIIKARQSNTP